VHAVEFSRIGRTRTSTTPTGAASTRGNFSNLDPGFVSVKSCFARIRMIPGAQHDFQQTVPEKRRYTF
jgi:hypothetical protein